MISNGLVISQLFSIQFLWFLYQWKFNMSSSIRHYWFWNSYYSFDHRYDLCKSSIYSYFYKYYMTKVQGGKIFRTWISYILFTELEYLQPFSSNKKYKSPSFFSNGVIICAPCLFIANVELGTDTSTCIIINYGYCSI